MAIEVTSVTQTGAVVTITGLEPGTAYGASTSMGDTVSFTTLPPDDPTPTRPILLNIDPASNSHVREEDHNVVLFKATGFNTLEFQFLELPNLSNPTDWKEIPYTAVPGQEDTYQFLAPAYSGYQIRVRWNDNEPSQEQAFSVVTWASRVPQGLSVVDHKGEWVQDPTMGLMYRLTLELQQQLQTDEIPAWRFAKLQMARPSQADPESPGEFVDVDNPTLYIGAHGVFSILTPVTTQYFCNIYEADPLVWFRFRYGDADYTPATEQFTNEYKIDRR